MVKFLSFHKSSFALRLPFQCKKMARPQCDTPRVCVAEAAVAYKPKVPLVLEDILVAPPQANEVRIKMMNACVCQSDLYFWKGKVNIPPLHLPQPTSSPNPHDLWYGTK
jgi:hypothetical protein